MKKFTFLSLLALFSLVTACNKDDMTSGGTPPAEKEVKLYALKILDGPETKGAALTRKLWETGQTIRIKFLNGTAAQQGYIQNFAAEWMEYANVQFEYVAANEEADVKIGVRYGSDAVTWAYLGTDANEVAQDSPTMNFGNFLANTASTRRDVLMMFGHMLGLMNEHKNINSEIPWDIDILYEYYVDWEGWTYDEVDEFFFRWYSTAISQYSEYDPQSIMVWPIEDFLTTDGQGVPGNNELSEIDKRFIGELYPFPVDPEPEYLIKIKLASSEIIKLYLLSTDDYSVDWGDGTIERFLANSQLTEHIHNYSELDDYSIHIYGTVTDVKQFTLHNNVTEFSSCSLPNLTELSLSFGQLTEVDLSKYPSLKKFNCVNNSNYLDFDFSANPKIERIYISKCSDLNLPNSSNLKTLDLHYAPFSTIDLSGFPELESLQLNLENITELDISRNTKLEWVSVPCKNLKSLDCSNNPLIVSLFIHNSNIENIDLSVLPNLGTFSGNSVLKEIDFSNNPKLQSASLKGEYIKEVDFSNNPILKSVNLDYSGLTALDFSENQKLSSVTIYFSTILEDRQAMLNMVHSLPAIDLNSGSFFRIIDQNKEEIYGWIREELEAKNWTIVD